MESSGGLASGDIDAALIPKPGVPPGQPCEDLYSEGFAFVVRKGNVLVGDMLSVKQFNTLRHIDTLIVQGRGGIGHKMAGDAFAHLGLVRDVALSVPTFSAAAMAASQSDFIAGIPERLAAILCGILPLRRVHGLLPPYSFPLCLTWHAGTDADPGSRFFRALVAGALKAPMNPGKDARKASKKRNHPH